MRVGAGYAAGTEKTGCCPPTGFVFDGAGSKNGDFRCGNWPQCAGEYLLLPACGGIFAGRQGSAGLVTNFRKIKVLFAEISTISAAD